MNLGTGTHPGGSIFGLVGGFGDACVGEQPKILEWLSPLGPHLRHEDVRTNRLDGIGEWFLQSDKFVNWCDGEGESDRATLFCSGAPGVGKTYLSISSLVIDKLSDRSADQKVAVAGFYCDFQYRRIQTPENILGALVKQLIRGSGAIPGEIDDAFRRARERVSGGELRVPEILPLLQAAIAPLERAFICIDGLDECHGKHLPELLRSLFTISQWSPRIRLLITGRPYIHREIEKYFPGGARLVQIKPTMEDVVYYLQMMLDKDPKPEAMDPDLKAEILKRVSETISDVFLLVSLSIAAILAEATIHDRRERLMEIANGLGLSDAYHMALGRMVAQGGSGSTIGMAALTWVSRSERPMAPDELCHALGVQIGSTDLNRESVPSVQTLLTSCLGLITIDKTGSTVRLVHFTLQEYLDSHSEILRNPYATMAEVCLTYLNYDCVNKLSPTLDSAPPTAPFLHYASTYWGSYVRNGTTEGVRLLALRLLINFDSHISAKLLLRPHSYQLTAEPTSRPAGFTGLHCAAYFGIDEIASALLQMEAGDINRVDFSGCTPLIWAAKRGHEGITKLLLKQENINSGTKGADRGQTALCWAASGGHDGVVKLLLEQKEMDAELCDNWGRAPLSHAAEGGSEAMVKMFLERGVNAELQDFSGRTPLSRAAGVGNEGTMKLLLEREDVTAESRDNTGKTPLSYAAAFGNERAVKLLLDREGVNPESRDSSGRTPLSYASQSGNEGTVKLFLEREEVNAELQDNFCRTPLSYAAQFGNERTVKLFLEREEVNAESQDIWGRTILSYAAQGGDQRIVKLFLERGEVNADSRDSHGRTPHFHEPQDNNGFSPLSHILGTEVRER